MLRRKGWAWRFTLQGLLIGLHICLLLGLDKGEVHATNAVQRLQPLHAQKPHVAPFMYRPYYGTRKITQRTVSYVDHAKPWYENDGLFVRFDGQKWKKKNTVLTCRGGVNCYDGHNGYDLDLGFEPVLSAAPGRVMHAGWYNPRYHNSSLGLWVAVNHGNGMATAYGHLSMITVAAGDRVETQWQLGTSGTTGSSLGPHLHMATYYLPRWQATDPFGWMGDYQNPNIVEDNYLWVEKPGAKNNVPDLSGKKPYPGAIVIDDGDQGWIKTGTWKRETGKKSTNGDLRWTAASCGKATATAIWHPRLPKDGYYEVGVFITETHASASWAPYTIYSADPARKDVERRRTVYVDQSHVGTYPGPYGLTVNTGPQWIALGTYYFRKEMQGRVILGNQTCQPGEMIAADAVEFVPIG